MEKEHFTIEMAQAFHESIASIIDEVQRDLIGYDTDFGFGQQRGVQTLVPKTSHRSTYLRLHWDTIMGGEQADRDLVDKAVKWAINALS